MVADVDIGGRQCATSRVDASARASAFDAVASGVAFAGASIARPLGLSSHASDDRARARATSATSERELGMGKTIARDVARCVDVALEATNSANERRERGERGRGGITSTSGANEGEGEGLPGRAVRRTSEGNDLKGVNEKNDVDEGEYIRYKDMFGAEKKFARSNTRARAAQADMYVQDYLERKVYGYAHVSVRKTKGRGRGVKRVLTMQRTMVGAGRPEDLLDFEGDGAKLTSMNPMQSLPTTFAMGKGTVASKPAIAGKDKTNGSIKPLRVHDFAPLGTLKKLRTEMSSDNLALAPAANPAHAQADAFMRALGKRPQPSFAGATSALMPGTIFDGSDWGDGDDMMFWDTLIATPANQRRKLNEHPSRDRTQSPEAESPSARTDETPSPTNDLPRDGQYISTVERRLRALEAKLLREEEEAPFTAKATSPESPTKMRRSYSQMTLEEHAADRGGFEVVNNRLSNRTRMRDDTARAAMTRDGKRNSPKSSGLTDGAHETSSPAGPTRAELDRLNELVESIQRRQERIELEREKEFSHLADSYHEHTAKLENIIASYAAELDRCSPRVPPNSAPSPYTPVDRFTTSGSGRADRPDRFYGPPPYSHLEHRYTDPGIEPRGEERHPSAHHHTRVHSAIREAALLQREIVSLERKLHRKGRFIQAYARDYVESEAPWARYD